MAAIDWWNIFEKIKILIFSMKKSRFSDFHGSRSPNKIHVPMADPQNSFLHRVLERRRGLPITLSVVYILVARRIGFEIDPIGLPGRFMVGCFSETKPFYIDVWSGGKFLEIEQMADFLDDSSIEDSGSLLLPVTVAETLTRGCRNLVQQYGKQGDADNARLFNKFVLEFENVQQREANA